MWKTYLTDKIDYEKASAKVHVRGSEKTSRFIIELQLSYHKKETVHKTSKLLPQKKPIPRLTSRILYHFARRIPGQILGEAPIRIPIRIR